MPAAYESKTHVLIRLDGPPTTQVAFPKAGGSPEVVEGSGKKFPTQFGKRWKRMARNDAEPWVRWAGKLTKENRLERPHGA